MSPGRRKSAAKNDTHLSSGKLPESDNELNSSAEMGDNKSPLKSDIHETCTNKSSPSSTEGVRENSTPEVPTHIPSPLPVLPESGSECISDSISDDVPSLTPQIPTPHSVDSLDGPKSVECTPVEESHLKSPNLLNDIHNPSQCANTEQSVQKPQESEQTEPVEQQNDLSFDECDTLTSDKQKLNESLGSDAEQLLADSSALASSSIVAEMEQQDMEHMDDDCDEIDNNSMGDIPSDDNLQDFDSDTSTQEALRATKDLEQVIAAELESSLEQTEDNAATTMNTDPLVPQRDENISMDNIASVGSVHSQHSSVNVPSVEAPVQQGDLPHQSPHHPHPSPHSIVSPHHHPSPHQPGPSPHLPSPHHTLSPHQNVSPQCNQINTQMFSANQQMSTNINTNTRYGAEIDVSQLAGLESPTSMSSTELQNTSGDGSIPQQQHRQQQPMGPTSFADCAQQQQQQTFCNNIQFNNNQVPLSYNCGGTPYMDTVNSAMLSNTGTYMPIVSTAQMNFMAAAAPPNNFTQVLIQQQHQNQQSQRLTHNTTPCSPNVRQGNPAGFGGQNSCSLAKLQQLTNGIMDIMPENQMTPPPQLTPPPSVSLAPPTSLMRTMQTPNPAQQSMQQQQQQQQQFQQQRQYQRQKSSSGSSSSKKNANIAAASPNPNVTFTPNMAIQPNTNMIPRYNIMDSYRMQQPMINTSYITANPSFINQLRQPMQMSFNMNPMSPMNPMNAMNPQQHFQQHMQPPQTNNVYTTYGYINGAGLQNTLNMNMRR